MSNQTINNNKEPRPGCCKIPGPNFGKKIEYKTVNESSIDGIKQAEKMVASGWLQGRVGLFSTQYYRYV